MKLAGLYAITPDAADSHALIERVRKAMHGTAPRGWAALQYRNKLAGAGQRAAEARALAGLCTVYGVPLIINDDVELALASGADGAHLGSHDGDLAQARARLGARLVGASCYDRLDLARRAVAAGADYVAFGSVFPSPTKGTRCPSSPATGRKPPAGWTTPSYARWRNGSDTCANSTSAVTRSWSRCAPRGSWTTR